MMTDKNKLYKSVIFGTLTVILVIILITVYGYDESNNIVQVKDTYTVSADEEHKALVEKGRYFFTKKCVECHDLDLQRKGPALRDVAGRRDPEWIIKMILNPDYMIKKDPAARALFKKHIIKMVVKDIDLEQAKALLEYLRSVNA